APLVAVAGEDLVLPCFIKPTTSAVNMTVEWLRLNEVASLVHHYKDHKDRYEDQVQSYRGRTSLFEKELQKGNVSLKLSALRVSDEGAYKCLIDATSWYDDITVHIIVEALGSPPVIMMESYDNSGGINLVCESRGWKPEPEVLWLDREGATLPAKETLIYRDSEGFSVKRCITVHDYSVSNRFYCRLQQKNHMVETMIIINRGMETDDPLWRPLMGETEIRRFHLWVNAVCGISHHDSVENNGCGSHPKKTESNKFIKKILFAVDVTLDPDTAHPYLILSADAKQVADEDKWQNLPDTPQRFNMYLNVLGKQSFSSGKFYYEVQVRGKTAWILGVMRENINRKGKITLTPHNGFWTVALTNDNQYWAYANTDVLLTLREKVEKVGVFVDYEEGLVSFYDVNSSSHLYSFTGQSFTGNLYPFFSPGDNDEGKNSAPLII
ncbi:butyrophilin-like protein 3, partial [Silurus meridionalis]